MLYGGTVEELRAFIAANEELAFDTETDGLNRRKSRIIGFSVANCQRGFYLCTAYYDPYSRQLVSTGVDDLAREILQLIAQKKLLMHNAAFDVPMTKNNYGIDLREALHIDNMLMLHLLDENRYNYKLKEIAAEVFGEQAKAEQTDLKASIEQNGGTKHELYKGKADIIAAYGIQDGILTAKLVAHFFPQLAKEDLESFFFEEVMATYKHVVIPMEEAGIKLDMPALLLAQKEIAADLAVIEAKIQEAIKPHLGLWKEWLLNKDYPPARTGPFAQAYCRINNIDLPRTKAGAYSLTAKAINALPDGHQKAVLLQQEYMTEAEVAACQEFLWQEAGSPGFNLSSNYHLKKLIFDTLKEKPLNTTPTGQPQIDDEMLDKLALKYPWAKDLRTYRKLGKIKGTYIDRFIEESEDGRFYASYKMHGTTSGRLSGDFQQLSRPIEQDAENPIPEVIIKHNNRIRAFFIADEGHVLIDDDYESAEPKCFAHISGEEGIKDIFRKGEDFYSKIALLVEGLTDFSADKKAPNYLGKKAKEKRQQAKSYALGIPYHMTGYKLQFELNIPLEQAEGLVKKYLNAFPNLKKWMADTDKEVYTNGFVRTEAGRIRHLGRAKELYDTYGSCILDDLELWKKFNEMPGLYAKAKQHRREFKNLLANGANVKIQGLVASMMNRATIGIAKEFKARNVDAIIIALVHDEVIAQSHESCREVAAEIIQRHMETAIPISVPMVAVPSFGYNIRDAKGA